MNSWPKCKSDGGASSLSCGELMPAGTSPNNGSTHVKLGKSPQATILWKPFAGSEYSSTSTISKEYLVKARIMLARCWKYFQLTPRDVSRSKMVVPSDGVKVV